MKTYEITILLLFLAFITKAQSIEIKEGNPLFKDVYTADPAALVHNGKVYLYAGHDECPDRENRYVMNEWLIYSSEDMVNWIKHEPFSTKAFEWAKGAAWASQVIEKDGKFWWYVTVEHGSIHGKSIGVAVSDSPLGPFKDARGSAIITNDMTTDVKISWDDIDPTVFQDADGQVYLFWGNTQCYYVKMKDNMIDFDGEIQKVEGLPHFTEAPWIHKREGWYYLSYAYQFPEKTAYAMSKSIEGPWEFKGILNEVAGNSNTNHQAIIEFKGKDYFIYHTGGLQPHGSSFRRSVCIDYLYYNPDGTMKRVVMTTEGIEAAKD
ncbi:MAG: glycoside hydrolase family 43 protein [Prolixibacteraceae bacterium]